MDNSESEIDYRGIHGEHLDGEQSPFERFSDTGDYFYGFRCLDRSYHTRHSSDYTCDRAGQRAQGILVGVKFGVSSPLAVVEHCHLAVEFSQGTVHPRFAALVACLVYQISGREVVGPSLPKPGSIVCREYLSVRSFMVSIGGQSNIRSQSFHTGSRPSARRSAATCAGDVGSLMANCSRASG